MSYTIEELKQFRRDASDVVVRLAETAIRERRRHTPAEASEQRRAEDDVKAYDDQIARLRRAAIADNTEVRNNMTGYTPRAVVTRDEAIYRPDQRRSWLRDVGLATKNNPEAIEALRRNNQIAADDARAAGVSEKRAISTTDGAGGEFVPPLWATDQWIAKARPRRVFADLIGADDLPPGTDTINIPKVNQGTAVAIQGTQNTAINVQDMTTTSVSAPVVTVAGGQVLSLQLVEQSPINVDALILGDLSADYAKQLNTLLWSGSGTGGNPMGVLTLSGTNSVAWTGTALTGTNSLYTAIASAAGKIMTSRFEAPSAIFMHPRRFVWMLAQQDTGGRPVIVPSVNGPTNAAGVLGQLNAQGPVGSILGLDIYLDATIPVNAGAGTNEDRIIVCNTDDLELWESHVRLEAFQQTYASQLSTFVRCYNYAAFQPARYPESISVISGTGLDQVI
ncbi:phage major capsid protein [Streptomyces sp. NPDC020917]|uniref:phage major capsid protein n=1 Tax=Streptomyces sp. NPDC020917 TaxID=3365102 RepID=UPI00379AD2D1